MHVSSKYLVTHDFFIMNNNPLTTSQRIYSSFTIDRYIIRCCQRLSQVAHDKTLWRRIDFRASPILLNDLEKYMKFLQPITTTLAIRGNLYTEEDASLSPCFFNSIKTTCTQLKELIIEEYYINGDKVNSNT